MQAPASGLSSKSFDEHDLFVLAALTALANRLKRALHSTETG
jgi:hypothetical protein